MTRTTAKVFRPAAIWVKWCAYIAVSTTIIVCTRMSCSLNCCTSWKAHLRVPWMREMRRSTGDTRSTTPDRTVRPHHDAQSFFTPACRQGSGPATRIAMDADQKHRTRQAGQVVRPGSVAAAVVGRFGNRWTNAVRRLLCFPRTTQLAWKSPSELGGCMGHRVESDDDATVMSCDKLRFVYLTISTTWP